MSAEKGKFRFQQSRPLALLRRAALAVVAGLAVAAPAQASGGLHLWPPNWTTLLLILVAFVILIAPINALIFKPLFAAIDAREERIAGARRRAEKLEASAQQSLERFEQSVREVREQAEQDRRSRVDAARGEQSAITTEARSEAEAEVERSRTEIGRALDEARASLRASTEPLAREAASRILGRSVS